MKRYPKINFPQYDFKIKQNGTTEEIFDVARKQWVVHTPEEWVRQHTIHYLIHEKKSPVALLSIEMPIKVNRMDRRCDIVVFANTGTPKMIVECKAPTIRISQQTVSQAGEYNTVLNAPFLMVTNGLQHYVFHIDFETQTTKSLKEIPDYNYLLKH